MAAVVIFLSLFVLACCTVAQIHLSELALVGAVIVLGYIMLSLAKHI